MSPSTLTSSEPYDCPNLLWNVDNSVQFNHNYCDNGFKSNDQSAKLISKTILHVQSVDNENMIESNVSNLDIDNSVVTEALEIISGTNMANSSGNSGIENDNVVTDYNLSLNLHTTENELTTDYHVNTIDNDICSKDSYDSVNHIEANDKTKSLKVMVWNIHGLGDKLKDADFLKYIASYDLIIFLETMKLDRYCPDTGQFAYKHFQRKYQHPRARKPAGGVGVLIKSNLVSEGTIKIVKNSDFTVWIKIKQNTSESDLYLGGVYIPPLDSSSTISSFQNNDAFNLIQEEISHFKQKGSIALCGDFNARTGQLIDYTTTDGNDAIDIISFDTEDSLPKYDRYSDDLKSNRYGKELIELCKSCNMRIMNGFYQNDRNTGAFTCYTPCGKSLIDYLICDKSFYESLGSFDLEPLSTNSDHRPLVFSVKIHSTKKSWSYLQTPVRNKTSRYYKYMYDHNSLASLKESLTNVGGIELHDKFIDGIVSDSGVNEVVNSVYELLETAISANCSKKYQKSLKNSFPSNKWFDEECKRLKRLANDYAKHKDLNIEDNLAQYISLKKSYKATVQRKKREYQSKLRNELDNLELKNSVDYWKHWDKLKNSNKLTTVGTVNLLDFEEYFKKIQSPPSDSASKFDFKFLESVEQQLDDLINDSVLHMSDHPITVHEVQFELKSLKTGKAPGIDGISNEFFKYLSDNLLHPLTTLFNYVWMKGEYPDKWSEGVIQPLHKKGSYNEPDNYRKLTLMACMGKIFEAILNKRLVFQSEATGIVDPNQFGFTQGCRTSDNVFIIDSLISYQKSLRKNLFITFIDFSKAFDFVNRSFLYFKMIKKGFGGRLVKVIRSMFYKSKARVRWQGELGASINSTHGVLQGGIVSPKLFNLYLSDLGEYLDQNCGITIDGTTFTHLLYADDLVLISETENGMQTLLKNVESYCHKWHLIINSQKSKVMKFLKPQYKRHNEINFYIDDKELEIVNSYKYLGHVLCNSKNIHKDMYAHLVTQAQKAVYALKDNTKSTVGYLPPKLNLKMFDTHILPVLEYNSEIWFPDKENSDLERIQLKFLRNMLGVRSQTATNAVLADTGRFPLLIRQHSSALKYLDRLQKSTCPTLLRKCLTIQIELKEKGAPCWLKRLSNILESINYDHMNFDLNKSIASLFDQANAKMMTEISDNGKYPKLRTYKTFKIDMRIEPYLLNNLSRTIYTSIARFRLSSHNLNIELGRHKRPYIPAADRICEKCDLNLVEDEIHCLMICPKWADYRVTLFEIAHKSIDGFLVIDRNMQFHKIMTSKDITLIIALGKFLAMALKSD